MIGDRKVFGMTPTCWDVTVPASSGTRSESARWMIDIAISLIRLSHVLGDSPVTPLLGQVEAKSDGPLYHPSTDITVTGTNVSVRSERPLGLYVFDGATADPERVEALDRRGIQIFNASRGSVAERVQQGLGWLTRARTSYDRPERFLYFFTALEALLSSDDKSAPIVQTIARHAAALWTNDKEDRAGIAAEIKKLYEVRSALVHAGKRGVSAGSALTAQYIVECLFVRVLEAEKLGMEHQTFCGELAKASFGLDWPFVLPEAPSEPKVDDAPSAGT
jgi:Apea-like HEPN